MILSGFSSAALQKKRIKMTPAAGGRWRQATPGLLLYSSVCPHMLNSREGEGGGGGPEGRRSGLLILILPLASPSRTA